MEEEEKTPLELYWKRRQKHGRDKVYPPGVLLDKFEAYKEHIDNNPIIKQEIFNTRDGIKAFDRELQRPYTIQGFCNFIKITMKTLYNWEKMHEDENLTEEQEEIAYDYLHNITHIRQEIYQQKLEGASVDIFKQNIIIRDLGLAELKEKKIEQGKLTVEVIDSRSVEDNKSHKSKAAAKQDKTFKTTESDE